MSENEMNEGAPKPLEIPTDEPVQVELPKGYHIDHIKPIQAELPKKRGRPAKIQKQMFVEMWNGSTNLNAVAETLGISKLSCSVRASNLRKEGVNLNRFKRGRKALKK